LFLGCKRKTFQDAFHECMNEFEDFFSEENTEVVPLQTGGPGIARGVASKLGRCAASWPRVVLPHAVVMALGVTVFMLAVSGGGTAWQFPE
jgi:hypothetical protein